MTNKELLLLAGWTTREVTFMGETWTWYVDPNTCEEVFRHDEVDATPMDQVIRRISRSAYKAGFRVGVTETKRTLRSKLRKEIDKVFDL